MKRIFFYTLAAGMLTLTLSQCKSAQQVTVNDAGVVKTETRSQTSATIHTVIFGTWHVTNVNGTPVDNSGSNIPYIQFGEDSANPYLVKCYAYNGCNYINGEYAVTPGGEMKPTSDFASTMRMCDDAPYEMGITLALNTVTRYSIEKEGASYTMSLYNTAGQTMLTLSKYDAAYINGSWEITSVGDTKINASNDAYQLVIDLNEGKIHGNVGCNVINGTATSNIQVQNSISFSNLATTRMTCPDIQKEQQIVAALSTVSSVEFSNENKTAHLKNAAGTTVLTLHRIDLR